MTIRFLFAATLIVAVVGFGLLFLPRAIMGMSGFEPVPVEHITPLGPSDPP